MNTPNNTPQTATAQQFQATPKPSNTAQEAAETAEKLLAKYGTAAVEKLLTDNGVSLPKNTADKNKSANVKEYKAAKDAARAESKKLLGAIQAAVAKIDAKSLESYADTLARIAPQLAELTAEKGQNSLKAVLLRRQLEKARLTHRSAKSTLRAKANGEAAQEKLIADGIKLPTAAERPKYDESQAAAGRRKAAAAAERATKALIAARALVAAADAKNA